MTRSGAPFGTSTRRFLRGLVGLIVCFAFLVPAAAAQASFPGRNGLIVFDAKGVIYTAHPDGTGLRKLVSGSHARWSPNGKQLVFERSGDIYTMSATGSGLRRLTTGGKNWQPSWSRTGTQIVYVHVQPNGHGDIYRMTSTGTGAVQLTNDAKTTCGDDHPSWSPINDTILYHQYSDAGCLGKKPAFTGNRILTVTAYTKTVKVILRDGFQGGSVQAPTFAPDGKHITIMSECQNEKCWSEWLTAYLTTTLNGVLTAGTYTYGDAEGTDPDLLPDQARSPDGTLLVHSEDWGSFPTTCDLSVSNWKGTYSVAHWVYGNGPCSAPVSYHPDWQPIR